MGVAAIQAGTAPDALLADLDQTLLPSVKRLNGHPFWAWRRHAGACSARPVERERAASHRPSVPGEGGRRLVRHVASASAGLWHLCGPEGERLRRCRRHLSHW